MLQMYFTSHYVILMIKYLYTWKKNVSVGGKEHDWQATWSFFPSLTVYLRSVMAKWMTYLATKTELIIETDKRISAQKRLFAVYSGSTSHNSSITRANTKSDTAALSAGKPELHLYGINPMGMRAGRKHTLGRRSDCLTLSSSCLCLGGKFSEYFLSMCCAVFGSCPHRAQAKGQVKTSKFPRINKVNN